MPLFRSVFNTLKLYSDIGDHRNVVEMICLEVHLESERSFCALSESLFLPLQEYEQTDNDNIVVGVRRYCRA